MIVDVNQEFRSKMMILSIFDGKYAHTDVPQIKFIKDTTYIREIAVV